MILCGFDHHAEFFRAGRVAESSTPMMAANRLRISCRVTLFLVTMMAIPMAGRCGALEDSAKALAQEISAALPAGENISCEVRNISSLPADEVARVEQTLKAELQNQGMRISNGGEAAAVIVTLSENLQDFVWTGEIREGDRSRVVMITLQRPAENRGFSNAMPVTIRSEKFWEGLEHILDAGEISNGAGKSWLVLLLPSGVLFQDRQSGSASTIEIASNQSASRDPWGNLNVELLGNTVGFFLAPRVCSLNLETRELSGCSPAEGAAVASAAKPSALIFDVAPSGPRPAGKGTEIEMKTVCGGASQFLATGAGDYTQTDTLQVFQTEPSGSVAASGELDFPGPITALHAAPGAPRAVVRNLTTGNYEAYRLAFSCGQ